MGRLNNKKLTEEDFNKKYTYDSRVKSEEFDEDQRGMLETYGDDFERVRKMRPDRVWTMVDGDKGMWLVAGLRYVNRIYYVVTRQSWKSPDEAYLIEEY